MHHTIKATASTVIAGARTGLFTEPLTLQELRTYANLRTLERHPDLSTLENVMGLIVTSPGHHVFCQIMHANRIAELPATPHAILFLMTRCRSERDVALWTYVIIQLHRDMQCVLGIDDLCATFETGFPNAEQVNGTFEFFHQTAPISLVM